MLDEHLGVLCKEPLPEALTHGLTKAMWHALDDERVPGFRIIEARRSRADQSQTLIVECECDGVPTKNTVGIQYRERLGLKFFDNPDLVPKVYALRDNFPVTMHQNMEPEGCPRSLCLYVESWANLRRSWTPERHLQRIRWWLEGTASGTLHLRDQPLEQLYFQSGCQLILPADFEEKVALGGYQLVAVERDYSRYWRQTYACWMEGATFGSPHLPCLVITAQPVVHGPIEADPASLGSLHDQLAARGLDLGAELIAAFKAQPHNQAILNSPADRVLIVIRVPMVRAPRGAIEHIEHVGVLVLTRYGELGVALGVLQTVDNNFWQVQLFGTASTSNPTAWRSLKVLLAEPLHAFSPELGRQANGISAAGPERGVLAGAGALGSALMSHWTRAGWGAWTVIDHDEVRPHNLARHTARERHIGLPKALAVKELADELIPHQPTQVAAIVDRASDHSQAEARAALEAGSLIVDATTTLDFPRTLAVGDDYPRAASAFLSPSGIDAVLLMEGADCVIRLDVLEAQYYRRLLHEPWGENHLAGAPGQIVTGASCRDVSAVIPNEYIRLHAANLARVIRRRSETADPSLMIWHYEDGSGAVHAYEHAPSPPLFNQLGDLTIIWDEELEAKVRAERAAQLPNETGGVLLGYFDHFSRRAYVVDAMPAPVDSEADPSGFVRGVAGLADAVSAASARTAGIVGYIGEWHSHPRNYPATPSGDDLRLLAHLGIAMLADGQPVLMLIVGEDETRWLLAGPPRLAEAS